MQQNSKREQICMYIFKTLTANDVTFYFFALSCRLLWMFDSHLNAASPLALCGQSWRHALVICPFPSQHRTVPAITLCFNRKKMYRWNLPYDVCLQLCLWWEATGRLFYNVLYFSLYCALIQAFSDAFGLLSIAIILFQKFGCKWELFCQFLG